MRLYIRENALLRSNEATLRFAMTRSRVIHFEPFTRLCRHFLYIGGVDGLGKTDRFPQNLLITNAFFTAVSLIPEQ